VTLEPSEVVSFSSTFDFLLPAAKAQGMRVSLSTAGPLQHRRPKLRLRFKSANEEVEYPYVEFRIVRAGSEEVEMESVSANLGFTLSLAFPLVLGRQAQFGFTRKFAGSELKVVDKALRALLALHEGADITLHDIEHDVPLGTMQAKTNVSDDWRSYQQLITDAILIADRFGLRLRIPERIGHADAAAVRFYKTLVLGEALPIESFSATLTKRSAPEIEEAIQKAKFLEAFVALPNLPGKLPLFGSVVRTGPVTLLASKAKIQDEPIFWKRFLEAQEGDAVPITIAAESIRAFLGPTDQQGLFVRPDPSEEGPESNSASSQC